MDQIALHVPEIEWVFHKYIPTKAVTILAAKGGVGKSALALWIAAEIARASQYVTLYVDLEQTTSHMIERYTKWNLSDVKNNIVIPVERDEFGNVEHAQATLSEIRELAFQHNAKLIILDSMTSFYSQYDIEKRSAATEFMSELRKIIVKLNAGLLLLAHTTKLQAESVQQVSADLVTGSAAVVDNARSLLFLSPDRDNSKLKRVQQLKHNYTERQPDFTFQITEDGIFDFEQLDAEKVPECIQLIPSTKIDTHVNIMQKGLINGVKSKKELRQLVMNAGGSATDATNAYNRLVSNGIINN